MKRILVIGIVLLISACVPRIKKREPVTKPREVAVDYQEIYNNFREKKLNRSNFKAKVRIDLFDNKRKTFKALLAYKYPLSFRLEPLNFFGQPSSLVISDGQKIYFYDLPANTIIYGDITRDNIERLIGIDLDLDNLFSIILGNNPYLIDPNQADLRIDAYQVTLNGEERIELTIYKDGNIDQVMNINIQGNLVYYFIKMDSKGKEIMRVTFHNYQEVDGYQLPKKLMIKKTESYTFELDFIDINIVEKLDDELFNPVINNEIKVYKLGDEGQG
ncbi:MAG: DUF4292 domain-containing protein [bacterium]